MRTPKFEIYKAKDGFRWRLKASNGRIIAESGEAYKRKKRCTDMVYYILLLDPVHSKDKIKIIDRT